MKRDDRAPPTDAASRSGLRAIIVNTGYLGATRAAAGLTRGVYAIVLAALLGPELYGLFNFGSAWYLLLVPIAAIGIDGYLIRQVGRDTAGREDLVQQTLGARLIAGLFITLLSTLLARLVETVPENRELLYIFSLAILGRSLFTWVTSVLTGYEKARQVFLLESAFRPGEVIVGVGLLAAGFGLRAIVVLHTVSWLLQAAFGLHFIQRHIVRLTPRIGLGRLFSLIRTGAPFLLSALLVNWILQGPLILFRHGNGDAQALGNLALAMQVFFLLIAIANQAVLAALPALSHSVAQQKRGAERYVRTTLRLGILMSGALIIGGLTLAAPLVDLLLGPSYRDAAALIPLTLSLVVAQFWLAAFGGLLVAHGQFWRRAAACLAGASAFSVAAPLLIGHHHALGAILATAIGLTTCLALVIAIVSRLERIPLAQPLVQLSATAGSAALVSLALKNSSPIMACIAASVAALTAAFATRVVTKADVAALLDHMRNSIR